MTEHFYCGFKTFAYNTEEIGIKFPTCLKCILTCHTNERIVKLKSIFFAWHSLTFITHEGELLFYPATLMEPGISASVVDRECFQSAKTVVGTGHHIYILTDADHVAHLNLSGKLRTYEISRDINQEMCASLQSISCTENLILGLNTNNRVGEVILNDGGHESISYFSLKEISMQERVAAVACGKEHVLLLTCTGSVFAFGNGSRGQLGNGSTEQVNNPERVKCLQDIPITQISCGGWHSVAISDIYDVYTWGWNRDGQLGLPANLQRYGNTSHTAVDVFATQYTPILLSQFKDMCIVKSACGSRHTVLLSDSGMVYTSGWNDYGQLGHGDFISRDSFTHVACFYDHFITDIFAAHWATLFIALHSEKITRFCHATVISHEIK